MKKFIILTIAALTVFASCKDFLNEAPLTSQSDELTLSTYKGLNNAVNGAYAYLSQVAWYGGDMIWDNELKTANGRVFIGSTYDTGRLLTQYQMNFSETSTSSLWSIGYMMIYAVNEVIDNLEGKGAPQDLANLEAECLFLRALAYFDLVKTFAMPYNYTKDASHLGVPVVLHKDPTGKPYRDPVSKVYEQIVTDLTKAEGIIDPNYARQAADSRAVVTLEAIQALLSRVYLYKEDWKNAAVYATKVIDSEKFQMWTPEDIKPTDPKQANCYRVDVPKGGEVIFEVYGATTNSWGGGNEGLCSLTGGKETGGVYGDASCDKSILDIYTDEGDVRKSLFKNEGDFYWTTKYSGKGLSSPDVTNTIILRLSEMYLTRAEAKLNDKSLEYDAAADLKMVYSNRGVVTATPATITGVAEERRREFAWEGHYWFDLARTTRTMVRPDYQDNVITKIEKDNKLWAMPIAFRELKANGNLVQNDGY